MRNLFNKIMEFLGDFFSNIKESITIEFILEFIKKPIFWVWTIVCLITLIFFISNGHFFRIIQIIIVGLFFYFVFIKNN